MPDKRFWEEKWATNNTPWHLSETHPLLKKNWNKITFSKTPETVFIPLCGKSMDVLWFFNRKISVFGVDLSEIALQGIFKDHNLPTTRSKYDVHFRYKFSDSNSNFIDLIVCDIFDLATLPAQSVDLVYDRAALVAIEPQKHPSYVEKIVTLSNLAPQLLITVEHMLEDNSSPPYCVSAEDVYVLYSPYYKNIELIDSMPMDGGIRGGSAVERLWWLTAG